MKKFIVISGGILLTACSSQPQTSQAPLDMDAVNAYQQKVYSGNTVPASQRNQVQAPVAMQMNASDTRGKMGGMLQQSRPNIILMPSIGYYHGHSHWHHW